MQISFWEKESFFKQQDVIIIGAGLAGLWCAFELINKDPKLKILILEKGIIPQGASTRNAGFACFGSPTELLYDIKNLGEEKTLEITEMRFKGIEKIRKVFGDAMIGFDNCGGYECLDDTVNNIEKIKEEIVELNKKLASITSDQNTFSFADRKLETFGLTGFTNLIENKFEGGLHSGKLVQAFTQKLQSLGVQIMNGIEVKSWQENKDEIKIETLQRITFTCSKMFVTTNSFTAALLPESLVIPGRGQVIVTNEINDLKLKGTFHFDEGFYYFRNVGKRILLGGARNKSFEEEATTELKTTEKIQQELEHFLAIHILCSEKYSIDHRWSGIMGFTQNKLPLIKKISDKITAVVACNGMGVALTPVIFEDKYFAAQ